MEMYCVVLNAFDEYVLGSTLERMFYLPIIIWYYFIGIT